MRKARKYIYWYIFYLCMWLSVEWCLYGSVCGTACECYLVVEPIFSSICGMASFRRPHCSRVSEIPGGGRSQCIIHSCQHFYPADG